jgi:hypothetical protein
MFGDLPATQICGPIIATIPGKGMVALTPGSTPTLPRGTVLNVDLNTANVAGVPGTIPSGQPLPRTLTLTVGVPQTPGCGGAVPVVARGAFKVCDNESPQPRDRVFGTYDYFYNLNGGLRSPGVVRTDEHREVFGFEKTFLDQSCSIGLRAPILQVVGNPELQRSDFGDLTFVFKAAILRDPETQSVFSAGLVVTVPSGNAFVPVSLTPVNDTNIQPFIAIGYAMGDFYFQGFSAINFVTDSRDVTYMWHDYGLLYFLYRQKNTDRLITSVTPALELHVNTPLNHRGSDVDPIPGIDIVDMTAGVWLQLHGRAALGFAAVVPFTGPHPFDFQLSTQFNCSF